ncbi:unnamed protein product [Meganyctiphanes norvegica]|uniref:Uncharacterized protein n=1 Tax=Meganyctiphanes norvegica TaxID=48144 RepID=A0AAV2PQU5_MEGNR
MALCRHHNMYIICIITFMLTEQVLGPWIYNYKHELFDTNIKVTCYVHYSKFGKDDFLTTHDDSNHLTFWLWPFEDGNITVQIKGVKMLKVHFKASHYSINDWKMINIKWPSCWKDTFLCDPDYGVPCSTKCENGRVELQGFEQIDHKYIQILEFEKNDETAISIQSDKKLLSSDCPPKVSGTNLHYEFLKSTAMLPVKERQTPNNPSIILYLILAFSFLVIGILCLYVWKLRKSLINRDESLNLSLMTSGNEDI